MSEGATTWDGLPVSDEKPHGATVVVFRRTAGGGGGAVELLLLHRAHNGPEYEGDWAWTPPSGARLPGEPIEACARRELREEAGLDLPLVPADGGSENWAVFVAEAPAGARATVEHDAEHDRCEWVSAEVAIARCRPEMVCAGVRRAAALIGA